MSHAAVKLTSHTTCSAKAMLPLVAHADRNSAYCYGSSFHGAVTANEGNMMKLPGWHLLSAAPQSKQRFYTDDIKHCVLGSLLRFSRNLVSCDVTSETVGC